MLLPQQHLEREIKGGRGAAGGVAPVHRALAVRVLVVGQHTICGPKWTGGESGRLGPGSSSR